MRNRLFSGADIRAAAVWIWAVAAIASCAAEEEPEPVAATQQAIDTCTVGRAGTEDCPDEVTGNCGAWSCSTDLINGCVFTQGRGMAKGTVCTGVSGVSGLCDDVAAAGTLPAYLACCGCTSRDACYPGDTVSFCGRGAAECTSCGPCQTCTGGTCTPLPNGTSCGTCRACSNGACGDQAPGTACSGGRCAAGAVCCSGCIGPNNGCLSSTDDHCGATGAACVNCGPCRTCNGTTCVPTTGTCDDGNACTTGDMCNANGGCTGTPIVVATVCNDNNECTVDTCAPATGCVNTSRPEASTPCDDGNTCSTGDRCTDHDADAATPRVCRPTGGVLCNMPPDPCRSTQCVGAQCPYPALPNNADCSTNNRCKLNEACTAGACVGEDRNCADDNPCTTDACVPTGAGPLIDPVTGCRRQPNTNVCDDGNLCTESDRCGAGTCTGVPRTCTPPSECFQAGTCNPGSGQCIFALQPVGTVCETTGECQSNGTCTGGTPTGTGGEGGEPGTAGQSTGGNSTGGTGTGGTGTAGESSGGTGNSAGDGSGGTGNSAGNVSTGGTTSSGGTGDAGSKPSEGLFVRDPGGCACGLPGSAPNRRSSYAALLAAGLAAFFARRTRRSGRARAA